MKRILTLTFSFLLVGIGWLPMAEAACTNTANLALCKPALTDTGWGTNLNANFDKIDPWTGHMKFGTDNTYDIGASGASRPRNLYLSGTATIGIGGAPAGQVYIKPAAGNIIGLVVDTVASPSEAIQAWKLNGTTYWAFWGTTVSSLIQSASIDLGNDHRGAYIQLGRNASAGVVGPAASALEFTIAGGGGANIWADATSKLRIHSDAPTGSTGAPTVSDTAGTVVGDQTSWHEAKEILRQWDDPTKALETVLATKIFDFRYKESSYLDADNQPAVFTGIVGFDRRDWFLKNVGRQQTPSLNEVNILGYHTLAIQALAKRVQALEARP